MKKTIMEHMEEIVDQSKELQKQIEDYEGVKTVEVRCECHTSELEHMIDETGATYPEDDYGVQNDSEVDSYIYEQQLE